MLTVLTTASGGVVPAESNKLTNSFLTNNKTTTPENNFFPDFLHFSMLFLNL